jgi:hypothetical protein
MRNKRDEYGNNGITDRSKNGEGVLKECGTSGLIEQIPMKKNREIIHYFDLVRGAKQACLCGHIDVIKLLTNFAVADNIQMYSQEGSGDIPDKAFTPFACCVVEDVLSNKPRLFSLITKRSENYDCYFPYSEEEYWNLAIYTAFKHGKTEIIEMIMEWDHGFNYNNKPNGWFMGYDFGKNEECYDPISDGRETPTYEFDHKKALQGVIEGRHAWLIKKLKKYIKNSCLVDECLLAAKISL